VARLAGFAARQPYRLVDFGEKTSLADVLGPVAEAYQADLYLCSGQISDTLVYRIAANGRPLVVFTFSDFDPSGHWDMPTVIGRKLQTFQASHFPGLDFKVVVAALTVEQVAEFRLDAEG
jgi:hypothetical protein